MCSICDVRLVVVVALVLCDSASISSKIVESAFSPIDASVSFILVPTSSLPGLPTVSLVTGSLTVSIVALCNSVVLRSVFVSRFDECTDTSTLSMGPLGVLLGLLVSSLLMVFGEDLLVVFGFKLFTLVFLTPLTPLEPFDTLAGCTAITNNRAMITIERNKAFIIVCSNAQFRMEFSSPLDFGFSFGLKQAFLAKCNAEIRRTVFLAFVRLHCWNYAKYKMSRQAEFSPLMEEFSPLMEMSEYPPSSTTGGVKLVSPYQIRSAQDPHVIAAVTSHTINTRVVEGSIDGAILQAQEDAGLYQGNIDGSIKTQQTRRMVLNGNQGTDVNFAVTNVPHADDWTVRMAPTAPPPPMRYGEDTYVYQSIYDTPATNGSSSTSTNGGVGSPGEYKISDYTSVYER